MASEKVIAVTDTDFDEKVLKASLPVLLDFWAAWCGPCRGFAPVFEAASAKHADIVFGKVNTEEQQELAAVFSIRSIPYVVLLRENVVLFAQAGALPAEGLESVIQQARALDMAQVHKEVAEQQAALGGSDR